MLLGFHLIWTTYGFWLPNDPRGSWSDFVRSWELYQFGPAAKVATRRSIAGKSHDHAMRLAAKSALKYPPVEFTGIQARAVGRGLEQACADGGYEIFACSVMRDHVHLVIDRHVKHKDRIIGHFKAAATRKLRDEQLFSTERTPWARRGWGVYPDSPADMRRAIRYVENNPIKEGLPPQRWWFVKPYEE